MVLTPDTGQNGTAHVPRDPTDVLEHPSSLKTYTLLSTSNSILPIPLKFSLRDFTVLC